ncbi:toll/interleukin-1 receptor domain-containing protein [Mycolicibacterium septicum]|uniref:toll/interleukin-1 receptor domain-containing protein n=1 Tax=Mycolicibacterium septicum TaxID=98668 RepID=UPI0023E09470|nr:toll/interleukin-1 receptor domain-containing protein [Mycolicibacterium septicum]MDF3339515.1 toll/interleukin-1 receptor domain-containing protein [Mycolicibacterium septicum]
MLYDAFISHASEDKDDFVRPLAERLRDEHVEVWYDEFSLRIGDSLRRSIDRGLSQSRFGIVILSPSFFAKGWAQREFDGLVAREIDEQGIVLPVWHGVTRQEVKEYSPPLADKFAASSAQGIERVVRQLCDVIRPRGSTLVIARDHLIDIGYTPPVVTDDWWLDVAAASESNPMEGGFQEAMGWGRWGFPLPEPSREPDERGYRLARAAMQMEWQKVADTRPITQITPPEEVHRFINETPGLAHICSIFPRYLIAYAPQLAIPGFGGQFEDQIHELYEASLADGLARRARKDRYGSALTDEGLPPRCDDEYVFRDPQFGGYRPSHIACHFVQGDGVASGPPVTFYECAEYTAWLLSERSTFLPDRVRSVLTSGIAAWGNWTWNEHELNTMERDFGYVRGEFDGRLEDEVFEVKSISDLRLSREAREDAVHRMAFSARLLSLPESGETLAERLLAPEFLVPFFARREQRG